MSLQGNRPKSKKTAKVPSKSRKIKKRQGKYVFSLDIGTRTVVGVVGEMVDGIYHIIDFESVPHTKRAMSDGQIEEIDEVARIVKIVKSRLEERLNMSLSHVAIAAAGRALKTQKVTIEADIPNDEPITEETAKAFEMEAISKAQALIDSQQKADDIIAFYCVGHSVMQYRIDNYPMQSIVGHKGKKVSLDLIAAFLPSGVVESLYAVVEKNKLTVSSLTLEPIAAMNVIIPPEVRLINIALVDIGAGTSDIAVSRDGSIVAYAMATTAGDEITEEIIKKYLVDFDTAEEMKLSCCENEITYKDILGLEHTVTSKDLCESLFPAVDVLAETIAQNIFTVNGEAPSAIFLVGGGSLIKDLPKIVAKKLDIPEARVAVGGNSFIKIVATGDTDMKGPEYVTPIGIGLTSVIQGGYDFSSIMLNDKKFRVFDTKNLTVLDVLMIGGFKTRQIIGRTGTNLTFRLNGQEMLFKGEVSTPAEITLNDKPTTVNAMVSHGDSIKIIPAKSGTSAQIKVADIAGEAKTFSVVFDGVSYSAGTTVYANGTEVDSSYDIQSGDDIKVVCVSKLSDLLDMIEYKKTDVIFQKGKAILNKDYFLCDGDCISVTAKLPKVTVAPEKEPVKEEPVKQVVSEPVKPVIAETVRPEVKAEPVHSEVNTPPMDIVLNGMLVTLPEKPDSSPHIFLELLNLVDIDLKKPNGNLVMTINDGNAQYMSVLHENDKVNIRY